MQNKISVSKLNFYYGRAQALYDISLDIPERQVVAFIGPSGCGKSTFLRTLNRMNDTIPGTRAEGEVLIDGENIYAPGTDVVALRRKVGMVFQKSNPFPKSIFENVAYGIRINGIHNGRSDMNDRVEKALRDAALWDEVKDRMSSSAFGLSGGQQQRLCIARALAVEPEVVLMDEPASASARPSSSSPRVAAGSRADVGSSMSSTSGWVMRVRASEARCCSPPDSESASRSRNAAGSRTRSRAARIAPSGAPGRATTRLSRTLPGNGVGRWKTIPTVRRRASTSSSASDRPRKRTSPLEGTSRRLQSRSSVDLPDPDAPSRQVSEPPSGTAAVTWSRATSSPKRTTTSSNSNSCTR